MDNCTSVFAGMTCAKAAGHADWHATDRGALWNSAAEQRVAEAKRERLRAELCECGHPRSQHTQSGETCGGGDDGDTTCGCCRFVAAGRKDDAGKEPWHLLPTRAVRAVVRVLGIGAAKYGDENWRKVEGGRKRYYSAAQRHITAWWEGEATDPESGQHHLAHAICCLLFLLEGGQ